MVLEPSLGRVATLLPWNLALLVTPLDMKCTFPSPGLDLAGVALRHETHLPGPGLNLAGVAFRHEGHLPAPGLGL